MAFSQQKTTYNSASSLYFVILFVFCYFVLIWSREFYAYIFKERNEVFANLRKKVPKHLGPHIAKNVGFANPQIATCAKCRLIKEILSVRKFADLRFAELIFGQPTFGF
jgi:hypothetical protein